MVKAGFDSVDTDGDGVIDYDEFNKWYEIRSASQETTEVCIINVYLSSFRPCYTMRNNLKQQLSLKFQTFCDPRNMALCKFYDKFMRRIIC